MYRLGLRLTSIATLLFSLPAFAPAQAPSPSPDAPQSFTIQGTVLTPDGKPAEGARVDIRSGPSNDDALADTVADTDGKFALFGVALATGHYFIHASALNYTDVEKEFRVTPPAPAASPSAPAETPTLNFTLTLKPAPTERGPSSGFTVVRVYYATDRKQINYNGSIQYAGWKSDNGGLAYGSCDVSIPENHQIAEIERPSIWRLEFYPDPQKHVILQKVSAEPEDAFFKEISGQVASSPGKEAFVFIHGYNVSFEDAALRTAQLAYDFGFKGAPIFYSWPSTGTLAGYPIDEVSIQQTVGNLKQFLRDLSARSGATVIHLIAHSMGNRALLAALSQLAEDPKFTGFKQFNTVVLAAPDVDRDVFMKLVAQIQKPQDKITLYVSTHDQALAASHALFHKEPRAGEGGTYAIVMPGLDTVDVSQLSMDALGHSYFGDNTSVVKDLLAFLKGKIAPRPGLNKVAMGSLAYWQLIPSS
jgi:esterase/lipase superfamily enzyme